MKKLLIVAGLLACSALVGCNGPSSQFTQRGGEALDSLKRLDNAHMDGLLLYQPHLLDAEKAVDAAHRAAKNEEDRAILKVLDQYFDTITHDRKRAEQMIDLARSENQLAERGIETRGSREEHKRLYAAYDDEKKQNGAVMKACHDEADARLAADAKNNGLCLQTYIAPAINELADQAGKAKQ